MGEDNAELAAATAARLAASGLRLPQHWVASCVSALLAGPQGHGASADAAADATLQTLLSTDLRGVYAGAPAPGGFPEPLEDGQLGGPVLLQVDEIEDVSISRRAAAAAVAGGANPTQLSGKRCLKLWCTDGSRSHAAMEVERCPALDHAAPGCKMLVSGCKVSRGLLQLRVGCVTMLGGSVERLVQLDMRRWQARLLGLVGKPYLTDLDAAGQHTPQQQQLPPQPAPIQQAPPRPPRQSGQPAQAQLPQVCAQQQQQQQQREPVPPPPLQPQPPGPPPQQPEQPQQQHRGEAPGAAAPAGGGAACAQCGLRRGAAGFAPQQLGSGACICLRCATAQTGRQRQQQQQQQTGGGVPGAAGGAPPGSPPRPTVAVRPRGGAQAPRAEPPQPHLDALAAALGPAGGGPPPAGKARAPPGRRSAGRVDLLLEPFVYIAHIQRRTARGVPLATLYTVRAIILDVKWWIRTEPDKGGGRRLTCGVLIADASGTVVCGLADSLLRAVTGVTADEFDEMRDAGTNEATDRVGQFLSASAGGRPKLLTVRDWDSQLPEITGIHDYSADSEPVLRPRAQEAARGLPLSGAAAELRRLISARGHGDLLGTC
eukprot:TRINITY_DN2675_c2_g1_i1.p1 TRINITY_DN2675_c2_g1~~TRINITY_DN2675_c2_g1_i1.p1  ORF type:complete len:600 (+),score=182.86 TRINITY_DN2675_c2_g1_i1:99-1898(+)